MSKENTNDNVQKCSTNCVKRKPCVGCGNDILIKDCVSKCGIPKLCVGCGEIVLMTCDELNKEKLQQKYHQLSKLPFLKKCACPGTRRFYYLSEVYQPCTSWSTYEDCDCS